MDTNYTATLWHKGNEAIHTEQLHAANEVQARAYLARVYDNSIILKLEVVPARATEAYNLPLAEALSYSVSVLYELWTAANRKVYALEETPLLDCDAELLALAKADQAARAAQYYALYNLINRLEDEGVV